MVERRISLSWMLRGQTEDINIVTIVAWAGVGKSTLVNHWLGRMAAENYRSAELVFGWSFYRQGSSGGTSSANEFLDAALTWFGDPDPRIRNRVGEGGKIGETNFASSNPTGSGWPGAAPKSSWSARRTASRFFASGAFARACCFQCGALRNYYAAANCGHCRSRAQLSPASRARATL